jgi:hypothetical protein
MVTVCAEVYVPATGLKVGVAVGVALALMVYAADATALLVVLGHTEIASMVSVADTVIGPPYRVELGVGAEPLVV